ncbi:restriction endonuclease subunit S [Zobellia laminariae]|uniref:restriction endonuclease subunit S n=1 Tax=Zobellia laminariae TaxID=248906 RepID=UPI0012D9E06F|nr:hypothetical protein [Zobellia laminariae]
MISQLTLPELVKKVKHSIKRGPFGGSLKKEIFVEKGYTVYEQQHAIHKNFKSARYFIDETKYRELSAFKVNAKDLIVSCSGTIGKIAEIPLEFEKGIINQALLKITLDEKIVLNSYFIRLFESYITQNKLFKMSHGSGLKNFPPMATVKALKFPIPPLETQKKIVAILNEADKLRQLDKQLIEKYDALTHSLFLDMFEGKTEVVEKIELGRVIKLIGGGTPSKKIDSYWDGDIPWASIKDLKSDRLINTIDSITISGVKNSATKIIPKGSLIIATRLDVGRAAICEYDMAINQDLKAIKVIRDVNIQFLLHLFKSKKPYFESVASGATVKGIKIEHITKLEVVLPDIEIQNQFAERVKSIEVQKNQAQKSLIQAENLFNSLLQKAFKGELVK